MKINYELRITNYETTFCVANYEPASNRASLRLGLRVAISWFAALIVHVSLAQTKEITILAVNDMHAAIERFPKFAALVDSMRTVYPKLLLFSAGDSRTGNPVNDMHKGPLYPVTALMNKTGFNLSVLGNHEFDGDLEALRDVVNHSTFRHVCANMVAPDSLRLHIEPYKIFEIEGVRIAVLGLIHQAENGLPDSHPDKMKNLTFCPPLEAAKKYGWLRYLSDVFILLVHDDHVSNIQLANQYPLADVLISGHSHIRIDSTDLHNHVLITQAAAYLRYVTHITLQLTDGKITHKEARLLDINAFSQINDEVQAMVDDFSNNETLHRVLTEAITDFDNKEALGCMLTDAIRIESGADIAFQNTGGVRRPTYPKGPLTVAAVYQFDPFGNEVILFELTGEEVLRLIETAYLVDNKSAPFVSGITYGMELDKQKKIKKLQVKMADGTPLDLQCTYKVVMNSYMAAVCRFEKADKGHSLFRTTAELTIQYLEKQPAVDYNGVKRVRIIEN